MSESTTTTMPYTNDDGDPFAALGVVSVRTVNNGTVDIPANVRKVLASEVTYFSGQTNTTKRELTFPTAEAADMFRAQVKCYAREHDLNAYLPAEDKYGKKINSGTMVTYRLAPHTERSAVDTATVTVSNASDLKIPAPAKPAK